ncbi:uncharacterized protein LOC117102116 [Anneissia japonica]|uniref:uncharacterized protein LOC117102116 n=1 Tax=Anneissia japonica TaxID=1529436 RepID=UPI001425B997|nr:uncharacterized protein LOC117102116 [Anneissia japonica]XP_033098210.1 uncharacterized protein LOC117102116 [Anneissia japonica]
MTHTAETRRKMLDEFASAIIDINVTSRLANIYIDKIGYEIRDKLFKETKAFCHTYGTGSLYEGMPLDVCNDEDIMFLRRSFPMVLFQSPDLYDISKSGYLTASQCLYEPLYLMLQANDNKKGLDDVIIKSLGRSGILMNDVLINMCIYKNIPKTKRRGPSIQYIGTLKKFPGYEGPKSDALDTILCMRCQWSPRAREFFTRPRKNWPSKALLDKMSKLDCFVVPCGPHETQLPDVEWRLSFSLHEKELLHEMPESHFKCMYVMKALKNKYVIYDDSAKPTPFCSYFVKTACLWMCERIPRTTCNIMELTRATLNWLIDCYQRRNLPHYFIPEQNLIKHLSTECDDVIARLTTIRKHLWAMEMSCLDCLYTGSHVFVNKICDALNIKVIVDKACDWSSLERVFLNIQISYRKLYLCFLK